MSPFPNTASLFALKFGILGRRRQWHPTPVLLAGKSHGWRSLVGCSPWGHEESDMTELLHFHFSLSCIGEGNGNPLQCSCLENPRDGGAWWAAVSGVAQSQTWLKRLSSSSSSSSSRCLGETHMCQKVDGELCFNLVSLQNLSTYSVQILVQQFSVCRAFFFFFFQMNGI